MSDHEPLDLRAGYILKTLCPKCGCMSPVTQDQNDDDLFHVECHACGNSEWLRRTK